MRHLFKQMHDERITVFTSRDVRRFRPSTTIDNLQLQFWKYCTIDQGLYNLYSPWSMVQHVLALYMSSSLRHYISAVDCGLWIVDCRLCIVQCGLWIGLFHLLKIHPHRRATLGSPSRHQLILQKTLKTLIDFEDLPSRRIKVVCDPPDINKFG